MKFKAEKLILKKWAFEDLNQSKRAVELGHSWNFWGLHTKTIEIIAEETPCNFLFWIYIEFFFFKKEASTMDAPPTVEASMAGALPQEEAPAMDASTDGGASMVDASLFF